MSTPAGKRRDTVALPDKPPADLSGFPVRLLPAGTVQHRAHRNGNGAWFFTTGDDGRFDLPKGSVHGTCYLADNPGTALREALGRVVSHADPIDEAELAPRLVSNLALPNQVRAAETVCTEAADFGVTREINTVCPYAVSQAWAKGWYRARFFGVSYEGRFDPGEQVRCLAMFDAAGPATYPADPTPQSALTLAKSIGMPIAKVPVAAALTIRRPPS